MKTGIVFNINEFAVHDGPGIRTTIFLKGCPLRCKWCHNPEGISSEPQQVKSVNGSRTAGREYSAEELTNLLNSQADIFRNSGGGVTFSGGEPLMQPEFVEDVIGRLDNIHVMIETSGYVREDVFRSVISKCNLVYFDIKLADSSAHKKYTGVDNALILENLASLSKSGIPFVVRIPLVPGVTDTQANLEAAADITANLPGLAGVDLMPYNRAAGGKYKACGKIFEPDWDESAACNADTGIFTSKGIKARVV